MHKDIYLTGKTKYESQRKAKQYEQGRVCEQEDCDVTLSMYNKKTLCFLHSPKEVGRVRGWVDPNKKKS